jgi:hypothetical protein
MEIKQWEWERFRPLNLAAGSAERDHNGQALAYIHFEDERGAAFGLTCRDVANDPKQTLVDVALRPR